MADSNASDLSAPLLSRRARAAQQRGRRSSQQVGRRHLPVARLAIGGIVVLATAVGLRILLVETPDGGRPSAEVAINSTRNANSVAGEVGAASIIEIGPEIPVGEIVPATGAQGAVTPGHALDEASLSPDESGNIAGLVEKTEYGPLPRMGANGQTPFAAYARPSVGAAAAAGRPRIAIVVTGLGINLPGTLDAVAKLPDNVTLAFAPYGRDLERAVGAARAEGHEIFLEVPLEPFDYPDNDPGPDTLLTGQAPRDNMRKLYRVMGKIGGYAGVINNMGARFTASGADFGPFMEELGTRGLGYLDDGSSNRSLAADLAAANGVPFAKASLMLDANPARAPILARLAELEDIAKRQGSAVGLITALPVSVDTVTEWTAGLEERGIMIVPASALMQGK
jgi:uncharacterized protein